jgi:hypothetical protein
MKFLTAILLSVALFQICNAQVEIRAVPKETVIGTVKNGGRMRSEMSYIASNTDTIYTILYQDVGYQHIVNLKKLTFSSKDDNFNKFYDVLKTFFAKENRKDKDYKLEVTVGDNKLLLSNYTVMGIVAVTITDNSGSFMLTEKQLDKLFGK